MKVDNDSLAKWRSSFWSSFSTAFFRISSLPVIRSFLSASLSPHDAFWTRILFNLVHRQIEPGIYSIFQTPAPPPRSPLMSPPRFLPVSLRSTSGVPVLDSPSIGTLPIR